MEFVGGEGGKVVVGGGKVVVVRRQRGGGASILGIFRVHSACVCIGGKVVRHKTLLTHGACL